MNKSYATKIQFRNAAKKAGVSINANDEYSRMKASIRHDYDIDNKVVTPYDRKYNNIEAVGFELYSLTAEQAMKLHAVGFELQVAIVPDFHGTERTAYIYRLPLAN